jgi:hypothetical protein
MFDNLKGIIPFTIGFISGFLACVVAGVVHFRKELQAIQLLRNHQKYMHAEYKIDEYLEELTSDRSADA